MDLWTDEHQHSTTTVDFRLPIPLRHQPRFQNGTQISTTLAETSKEPILVPSIPFDISSTLKTATGLPSRVSSISPLVTPVTTTTAGLPVGHVTTILETLTTPDSLLGSKLGPNSPTTHDESRTLFTNSISPHWSSIAPVPGTSLLRISSQPSPTLAISLAIPSIGASSVGSTSDRRASLSAYIVTSLKDRSRSQSTLLASPITSLESEVSPAVDFTRHLPSSSILLVVPTILPQATPETISPTTTSLEIPSSHESRPGNSSAVVFTSGLTILSQSHQAFPTITTLWRKSSSSSGAHVSITSTSILPILSLPPHVSSTPMWSTNSTLQDASFRSETTDSSQNNLIPVSAGSSLPSSSLSAAPNSTSSTNIAIVIATSVTRNETSSLAGTSVSNGQWPSGWAGLVPTETPINSQDFATASSPSPLESPSPLAIATPIKNETISRSASSLPSQSQPDILLPPSPSPAGPSSINPSLQFAATTTSVLPVSSTAIASPLGIATPIVSLSLGMNQTYDTHPTPFTTSGNGVSMASVITESSSVSHHASAVFSNATTTTPTIPLATYPAIPQLSTMIATIASQSNSSETASSTSGALSPYPSVFPSAGTSTNLHGNSSMPSSGLSRPSSNSLFPQSFNASEPTKTVGGFPTVGLKSSSPIITADSTPVYSQTSVNNSTADASPPQATFSYVSSPQSIAHIMLPITQPLSEQPQRTNVNETRMQGFFAPPISNEDTITTTKSTFITLSSARGNVSQSTSSSAAASLSTDSSTSDLGSKATPSPVLKPILPPVSSASTTMLAEPESDQPILTLSQTAGVATASFAGVLLAVIAAIFVVRRYHSTRAARHNSTMSQNSMYPKMGHLYDPPAARRSTQDDDDNNTPAFMSGGAEGLPPQSAVGTARTSLESGAGFGLGVSPFSDPGNPFRDSNEYTQAYIEASGSSPRSSVEVPAALRIVENNSQYDSQYRLTSQWSATESDNSRPSQESHEYPCARKEPREYWEYRKQKPMYEQYYTFCAIDCRSQLPHTITPRTAFLLQSTVTEGVGHHQSIRARHRSSVANRRNNGITRLSTDICSIPNIQSPFTHALGNPAKRW
ncbi:hypothetical protein IAQ61_010937 [Plenodomus lingam]|uniref:uncharacterized protein n=1 Tax=Leptosphaeria maculans TaxID=5022 RepID=UPI00331FDD91|nr:hypothetical protein IAQ61_010937 [Plenodomus lingam]